MEKDASPTSEIGVLLRLALLRFAVFVAAAGLLLFGTAGRLSWRGGWAYLGLVVVTVAINLPIVLRRNPELVRERAHVLRPDTKGFDKVFVAAYLPGVVAILVVAALDAGREPARSLSVAALVLGVALHLAGDIPVAGALATNRHLEPTVRIQNDRGHRVVSWGPYRYVRHPMYVGMIAMFSAWPLVLGSRWAFLPAGMVVVLLVLRTALEDRTLQAELAGYADYVRRPRYRLLPGVW